MKPIKIAFGGNESQGEVVKKILEGDSNFEIIHPKKMKDADLIYWVFGKGPSFLNNPLLWMRKKPILLIHWIGTDVLKEITAKHKKIHHTIYYKILDIFFKFKSNQGGIINFAGAPWLVEELKTVNISSVYVPLTTIDTSKVENNISDRVKEFDFISYVPSNQFEFYGGDKIIDFAKRWPNYKFLIIQADLTEIPHGHSKNMPSNIIFSPQVKHVDMQDLYRRSKVFIRYTKHDGLSLSVLEAMFYQLQVLWTYDFPYTIKIKNQNWLSDSIPEIINNWYPNEEGCKFVIDKYSISSVKTDLIKMIKQNIKF